MRYCTDLHTHTVASGHAQNTIEEMIEEARKRSLTLLGITEHSVLMPGTCTEEYFEQLTDRKRDYGDIEVLFGVELNILDYEGAVDLDEQLMQKMDLCIASIHIGIGYEPGNLEQNTNAIIGAIKKPFVNIIGHLDDGKIPVDYEKVIDAAMEYDVLLEINNNSLAGCPWRENARENITRILEICKYNKYPVCINSDAHSIENVGRHNESLELIKEVGFPEEYVLNFYPEKLKTFLNRYKNTGF